MNASEMTLALYYAKKAVKEQWRAQGLKPPHIKASELSREADAYLDQHLAELIERACATLESTASEALICKGFRCANIMNEMGD